jgi:hypothetical protein
MKKITLIIAMFSIIIGNAQNLITNGDFSNGGTGWILDGGGTVTNGEATFATTNAAGNPWDTQLAQSGFAFTNATTYTLTFKARAASNRNITVAIQNPSSGWSNQVPNQVYALTTTMQTFTQTVVASSTSANVNLAFLLANQGGSTAAVYIDDVSITGPTTPPAQMDLLLGFETTETGGIDGGPFGGANTVVENGISTNTSKTLKVVGNLGGENWQGVTLNLTSSVNLTTTKTMTMDVYSATPINFLVKVQDGVAGAAPAAAVVTHNGNSTWQTLSFTFNTALDGQAAQANGVYREIVVYTYWTIGAPNYSAVTKDARTFYVDNIRGPLGVVAPPPVPTVAAPMPPARPAADVKSIFSNAYTPIVANMNYAGVNGQPSNDNTFNTEWCGANTTLVQIAGNDTNKVDGLGCEGVAFLAGRFNATTFTHFHMDIWTATPTLNKSFNVKFSNWNGTAQETNAYEFSVTNTNFLTNPNPGTWISLDIPLSSFTCVGPGGNPCPSRNDFVQFVITSDLGLVYYDNLYLHKNTLSSGEFTKNSVSIYPNPVQDVLTINTQETLRNVTVFNINGQQMPVRLNNNTIDVSSFSNGVYLLNVELENGAKEVMKFVK